MTLWLGIALLGALGALARFHVGAAVRARLVGPFPYGTFVVNLTGSFVLGLLIGLSVQDDALLLAGTRRLSGYTTFSTWMVEALALAEQPRLAGHGPVPARIDGGGPRRGGRGLAARGHG